MKMKDVSEDSITENDELNLSNASESSDDQEPLRCWECNVNFTSKFYLHKHLFHHIRQPYVRLERTPYLPPLKITLKNTTGNSFEIINSPIVNSDDKLEEAEENEREKREESSLEAPQSDIFDGPSSLDGFDAATLDDINGIIENETGGGERCDADADMVQGPIITEIVDDNTSDSNVQLEKSVPDNYDTIPGAEPTPPPDPSPDSYPKIRIKTTGLLKDPPESRCTITEITDDNPNGDPTKDSSNGSHMWSTPSLEDPLKIHDSEDNILSLFNNNDRAKDFGFTSSDSEYISLDRLDSRSSGGSLQLYNPPTSSVSNSLESLTGLPMQALAQQVSRLQPSGNGMHQQNVLINIQQFPQAPPQAPYQPPPMYHHSSQPMYQPYQYQPPNPMYYPTGPSYPPPPPQHMQQPPQMPHPMGQPPMSQAQIMPPSSQNNVQNQGQTLTQQQHPQQQQQQQYRQTMPTRPPVPRPQMPGQRMGAPRQPMPPRGGLMNSMNSRQRAPLTRPRGGMMTGLRGVRPRMPTGPNQAPFRPSGMPIKRTPTVNLDNIKQEQNVTPSKKKRFDVLTPDKDDEDCQVICMQPKNVDGFPQIESVQGATGEPPENSIMHLSDSITLSVRNPPPKPLSPKKSDAKAVANILATRGITVTPTPKPKEKPDSPMKNSSSPLNLNGAVTIIPSAAQKAKKSQESDLPTVDLTDDVASQKMGGVGSTPASSPQKNSNLLPYRCYLCPAQYPNALGLSRHQQTYHKTTGPTNDMGIPLVNLKQPGVLQKLGQLGIFNFIPLPTSQPDGTFALPIINSRNPGNVHALGASNMLVLGPVKSIPKPNNARPQGAQQK